MLKFAKIIPENEKKMRYFRKISGGGGGGGGGGPWNPPLHVPLPLHTVPAFNSYLRKRKFFTERLLQANKLLKSVLKSLAIAFLQNLSDLLPLVSILGPTHLINCILTSYDVINMLVYHGYKCS